MVEGSALEIMWGERNRRGWEAAEMLGLREFGGCESGRVLTEILRKIK